MMLPPKPTALLELTIADQDDRHLRYPPGFLPADIAAQVANGTFNPLHTEITPEAFVEWWCEAVKWANHWPHEHPEGRNCWAGIVDLAMKWLTQAASNAITHAVLMHKGLPPRRQHDIMVNVEGFWLAALHVAHTVHALETPLVDAHLLWRQHWNLAVQMKMKTDPSLRTMLIVHEQPKVV
jgi:hypothetical protein